MGGAVDAAVRKAHFLRGDCIIFLNFHDPLEKWMVNLFHKLLIMSDKMIVDTVGTPDALNLMFSGGRKQGLWLRQIASPLSLLGGLAFWLIAFCWTPPDRSFEESTNRADSTGV